MKLRSLLLAACVALGVLSGCAERADPVVPLVPQKAAQKRAAEGLEALKKQFAGKPLVVSEVSELDIDGASALVIGFSAPLDPEQSLERLVSLVDDKGARLEGGWERSEDLREIRRRPLEPGRRLTVVVAPATRSIAGVPLGEAHKAELTTRDQPATIGFASRGTLLPTRLAEGLPVIALNVSKVEVEFHRLRPERLHAFLGDWNRQSAMDIWQLGDLSASADLVYTGHFSLDSRPNTRERQVLPVDGIKALAAPGVYLAVMRPSGQWRGTLPVTVFTRSDIGLSVRRGARTLDSFVQSLESGRTLANVKVELIDEKGLKLADGFSNGNGHLQLPLHAQGRMVLATHGNDTSLVALGDPALDLAEFKVEGPVAGPLSLFVFGPRDLYRPGETVPFNALLRDADGRAVPPQPVKATLVRPDGEAARSFVWEAGADGLYQTRYTLADDAPSGRWQLRLDLGGMKVVHEFLVEDFLPERLALELAAAAAGPLASADVPQVTAQGRYLHGAPAAGNRMIGQLFLAPLREAVPALPGFQFGDVAEAGLDRVIELEERWLDDDGAGDWTLVNDWSGARSPLELTLQASVQESGGRPVTRRLTLPVWPAERLVGIRPLFNGDTVDTGSEARFEIVVADRAGQRLAAEALEVRLVRERRDYFWQFSESEGWSSQFNQKDVTLSSATYAATSDTKLEVALPVEWGGYRVEVHDPHTGLVSSVRFQAGYDWQQNADEGAVRPDQVRLALDKPRYQAGEVAQVRVEPPAAGKGYLAVESADGVLWWQAIEVPAEGKSFALPIPHDWARHDLYVSALVVRPGERAVHVVPRRAVGLLHLPLDREARRLAVKLETPAKMRPGRALPVKVSVPGQAGRAVRVLVSAVDVGILNLTQFATPDPFEAFFGRRGYAIDQLDVYGQLIEVGQAKRGRLAFGGDAERDRGGRAPISSVTLVALQAQPVLLDANGEGEVRLDIPDFNGELRIMAQAWSDEAYGMAEGKTVVAAPVLVDLAAPRFLAGGDRSQVAVDISNLTETPQTLRPTLEVDGLLRAEGSLPAEIVLAPGKRHTLQVPVSAAAGSGAGTIRIGLTGVVLPDEAAEPVSRSWTIGVRPAWPAVTESHAAALQPGEAWSLAAQSPLFARLEDRRVRVNLASRPPLNLAEHVVQLLAYPYGCAEQTTSGLYPSLYARPEVLAALGIRGEAGDARRAKIERGIERLLAMQRYNGSFGLWNRDGDEEYWLTAYVTDFLLRAVEEGFAVPETALDQARARLLAYVQNEHLIELAYSDDDRRSRFAVQAYAAYVLARTGQAPLGALRQIHERRAQAPSGLALAQLGFALVRMGDGERGNALLREAIARPGGDRSPRSWYADYGSALRDTALMLALLEEHELLPGERPALYLALADMLKRDDWLSTQERNALFLAGRQVLVQPGEFWSAEVAARGVQTLSAELPRSVVIDETELGSDLGITNQGVAPLFQRLTLTGYPREPLPADAQHIAVERRMLRPDGTPVEGPLASGELVLVHLSVRATTRVHDALVVDLLPAGLELENQRLDASARLPAANEEINTLLQRREEIVVAHEGFMADRYVAAVELPEGQRVDLLYLARAVTPGVYRVPPSLVESMYSPQIQGRGATPGALTIEARQR